MDDRLRNPFHSKDRYVGMVSLMGIQLEQLTEYDNYYVKIMFGDDIELGKSQPNPLCEWNISTTFLVHESEMKYDLRIEIYRYGFISDTLVGFGVENVSVLLAGGNKTQFPCYLCTSEQILNSETPILNPKKLGEVSISYNFMQRHHVYKWFWSGLFTECGSMCKQMSGSDLSKPVHSDEDEVDELAFEDDEDTPTVQEDLFLIAGEFKGLMDLLNVDVSHTHTDLIALIDPNKTNKLLLESFLLLVLSSSPNLLKTTLEDHYSDNFIFLTCYLNAGKSVSVLIVEHSLRTLARLEPKNRRKDYNYVIDRATHKMFKEAMDETVRKALRVMYSKKHIRNFLDGNMGKKLLHKFSEVQAQSFLTPGSTNNIAQFIETYQINVSEIEQPLSHFKTFNEFFVRTLKPGVRPIAAPSDPQIAVCPADCRLTVFDNFVRARQLWIKGKNFTLSSLLEDAALEDVFEECSLVIARLAPQDYHRFHFPVDGLAGKHIDQGSALFTVNPIAVREEVDVFTENKRKRVLIQSEAFGQVLVICVGATIVGSVVLTAQEDCEVHKGDELGYFAFGGSTILILFQKDKMCFDKDLVINSSKQLETLVKMGQTLGTAIPS